MTHMDENILDDEDVPVSDDFQSLGEQLVEAVLGHSMTGEALRSSNYAIENSLYKMASAFADSTAGQVHIDDLKTALKTYGHVSGLTAKDQAKHAYGVMEYKMETLS